MSRAMPFILCCIIGIVWVANPWIPLPVKSFFYALSLTLKSAILFVLPGVIFGLLFKSVVQMARSATHLIFLIIFFVCGSNLLAVLLSALPGQWIYGFDLSLIPPHGKNTLEPLWDLSFSPLISNDKALLAGMILGFVGAYTSPSRANKIGLFINNGISFFLKGFVFLIPFFVTGFFIKLKHEGLFHVVLKDYLQVFLAIIVIQCSYILGVGLALYRFNPLRMASGMAPFVPALISAFTTMSSAISMPLTLIGAQKTVKNKELISSMVPATSNVHLVGDCFTITLMAYAVLKSFGAPCPSWGQHMAYSLYFVVYVFSIAAVPAGGILAMLPLLQSNLGFHGEMLSLITALCILFDPFMTATNVFANGVFAQVIDRMVEKFPKLRPPHSSQEFS